MKTMDREARKQVLLTRIAYERVQLRSDVRRVHDAVRVPRLLQALVGFGAGGSPFGKGGAAQPDRASGWLQLGLTMLRRYRLAAALLGGVAPILRAAHGWKRIAALGTLGAAAWFGWRAVRRPPPGTN